MTVLQFAPLNRLRQIVLLRYAFASVGALAVDIGIFLALLPAGASPVVASVMGYGVGIMIHWILSIRMVFADHVAPGG